MNSPHTSTPVTSDVADAPDDQTDALQPAEGGAQQGSRDFPPSIDAFVLADGSTVAVDSPEARAAEEACRRDDRSHVFHSWSAQGAINPQPIAMAEGVWIYDYQGRGYFDLASQLVSANLGHAHPDLVAALQRQVSRVGNLNPVFANDVRGELAATIVDRAQGEFSHIFFTNGGADAVEHAIRLARLTTGRKKVLSAYRSYHGATGSAIMATGEARRHGNPTTDGDIKHFWGPFLFRSAFHATSEQEECERALEHLEQTLIFEDDVAAVLIEPVVGSSGIIVPPEGYLQGVREICDRHGAKWIADEVMVGFGRTGRMFAYEHGGSDVQPDLVTFAKGVNGGMAPLGGVMMTDEIYRCFTDRAYPGGLTYSGHPVACAPGVAAQEVYRRDGIFEHVAELGDSVIRPALEEISSAHPEVGNVRGRGFFWAIEFIADATNKQPLDADRMAQLGAELKKRGLWPMVSANRLHIAPPLITTEVQLRWVMQQIAEAVEAM